MVNKRPTLERAKDLMYTSFEEEPHFIDPKGIKYKKFELDGQLHILAKFQFLMLGIDVNDYVFEVLSKIQLATHAFTEQKIDPDWTMIEVVDHLSGVEYLKFTVRFTLEKGE